MKPVELLAWQQVKEQLMADIYSDNVKNGDRLDSERTMMRRFGVTRDTLRRAFDELRREGLIYSVPASGHYVSKNKNIRNLRDLQSLTEWSREREISLETEILKKRVVEADKDLAERLRVTLGSPIFYLQRLRILDGKLSLIENSYISLIRFPGIGSIDLESESLYRSMEEMGAKFSHGEEEISITHLTEEEADLFGLPPGSPAFFLRSLVFDTSSEPLEYLYSVHPYKFQAFRYDSVEGDDE